MTFNTNNPTNTTEKNFNVLVARFQKTRSDYSETKAVDFAKANWAELGEDFHKAAYWVFGRETFVKTPRGFCPRAAYVENLILVEQEENHEDIYDV